MVDFQRRLHQTGIYRLLGWQLLIACFFAASCYLFIDRLAAFSALVGATLYLFPSWMFALVLLRRSGARAAKNILAAFYWGEAVKWFITIGLFVLVIFYIPVSFPVLLVAYVVMQLSHWLAPIVLKTG